MNRNESKLRFKIEINNKQTKNTVKIYYVIEYKLLNHHNIYKYKTI